jgi:hypothetical protein
LPPEPPAANKGQGNGQSHKTDWDAASAHSRELGRQGERFVRDLEMCRLRELGREDLAARVDWVADTQGDGLGYDIRSFDGEDEIFIEVKTTKGPEGTSFYITPNELRCSDTHGPKYRLYRVFQFTEKNPKLYRLTGPLTNMNSDCIAGSCNPFWKPYSRDVCGSRYRFDDIFSNSPVCPISELPKFTGQCRS